MEDERVGSPVGEPAVPPPSTAAWQPPVEGRPSRWLALAFVALLSTLVLMATTGVGAAASTLLGGQEMGCGGP